MRIYKLLTPQQWQTFQSSSRLDGAPIDIADGFIHFSTSLQVKETAAKHFAGNDELVLLEIEADNLGEALKWEVSRGGDLFPHLYAPLALTSVRESWTIPRDASGAYRFPAELSSDAVS